MCHRYNSGAVLLQSVRKERQTLASFLLQGYIRVKHEMKVNLFTHSSHLAYQLRIKCSLSHKWMDDSLKGKMILRHNICLGFFF